MRSGSCWLYGSDVRPARTGFGLGSQRAKMSKNPDFLGLWAALGGQSGRLMAHDAVRALVGLPMGSTSARMAEFGRIWPPEPGVRVRVRVTLSPAQNADFCAHWLHKRRWLLRPATSTVRLKLKLQIARAEPNWLLGWAGWPAGSNWLHHPILVELIN